MRFGTAVPTLPSEPVVLVRGRVSQLDLPAYAVAWTRLRREALPTIRAQMVADEMLVAGRRYAEVSLQAERTGAGTDLLIDSAAVAGMARWPTPPGATQGRGNAREVQPAELHLTRLDLPDGTLTGEGIGLIAALGSSALLSVDELNWRGRSLGRLTANVSAEDKLLVMDDARLVNGTQDAHGVLRCQTAAPMCRLSFVVESSDAAATLADFGFKPDVAASEASLKGDLEWHPMVDWMGSLRGTLAMRLTDGSLHGSRRGGGADAGDPHPAGARTGNAGAGDAHAAGARTGNADAGDAHVADARLADVRPADAHLVNADREDAHPFGLLAVPALVSGLNVPGAAAASLTKEQHDLHFSRLEADFELHDGQATTSNLHFDGDAEILMRGRVGLVSRDYDQQVWVLRGEERLPAAVRRFGATPSVAAAWLSLRDLFAGSGAQDRSQAVLRLQGSWDDPMVVTAN
jgi:uncharacterized protein YhdP